MRLHVSNLHLNTIETDLHRLFSPLGEVRSIEMVRDKLNNRSKGRAYVDMPVEKDGRGAILQLHGTEILGKRISVTEVKYDPTFSTHSFDIND
jgi:RNA recognition motif-containing protein